MKRPDIILAGATRSGLEALHQILDCHPQIQVPNIKKQALFFKSQNSLSHRNLCKEDFNNAVSGKVGNQISERRILIAAEQFDPAVAYNAAPNAKIIFTLREPVERAYVQYLHAREKKRDKAKNFIQAIEEEISGKRTPDTTGQCWIYKNQYQTHIEHWLSFYPHDQLFLMIYEEWSDPNQYTTALNELGKFLGLPADKTLARYCGDVFAQIDIEAQPKKYTPLSDTLRAQMEDILSIGKTYVTNFIRRSIHHWNTKL